MSFILNPIIQLCFLSFAYIIGSLLPFQKRIRKIPFQYLLALSAGLILGSAFLLLMPEAYERLESKTSAAVLMGLLFIYLIESSFTSHNHEHCHHDPHAEHAEGSFLSFATFVALWIHALSDGMALAAGEHDHVHVGSMIVVSLFTHKIFEAFSINALFISASYSFKKIFILNAFFLLAVPIGFLLSSWGLNQPIANIQGYGLAFSAGVLIHLGLLDLLPEVHQHSGKRIIPFLLFLLGVALMFILSRH